MLPTLPILPLLPNASNATNATIAIIAAIATNTSFGSGLHFFIIPLLFAAFGIC